MDGRFIIAIFLSCRAIFTLLRLINGASFEFASELRRGEQSAWALAWTGLYIHAAAGMDSAWVWLPFPLLIFACVEAIRMDLYPTHLFPRDPGWVLGRIVRAILFEPPVKPVKPPAPTPGGPSESH